MIVRQYRQAVGADFIRHVTIGGNAIRADPDSINLARRHQAGGHRIRDQLVRHTQLAQFPGG